MKLLIVTMAVVSAAGSLFAGELVYNLLPWGYEDHCAIPWKYPPRGRRP